MLKLILGDCIAEMRKMPAESVDCVVTDSPYGIRFMGKAWDGSDIEKKHSTRKNYGRSGAGAGPNGGHNSAAAEAGKYDLAPEAMRAFQEFSRTWSTEAFRVLKPGGYLLSFSSARTYHRMTSGIEDAGFEIRDQIMWVYGSGFPKSLDISKALKNRPEAQKWQGWGTALKPAHEPICVARKPLIGTVAKNILKHDVGGLNIDGCRVPFIGSADLKSATFGRGTDITGGNLVGATQESGKTNIEANSEGRFPANLIHDGSDEVLECFPDAKGQTGAVSDDQRTQANTFGAVPDNGKEYIPRIESETSAARFFYCAKASKTDRDEGLNLSPKQYSHDGRNKFVDNAYQRNGSSSSNNPTVKPTALMRYLVKLVCPPGGVVLDPFNGSGSTGKACAAEGFGYIGIEMDPAYVLISEGRISAIDWVTVESDGEIIDSEILKML